ncbi:antibiotic ABC transporter permease [Halosimplex amylolyticum]|uniref:antibiotic ABC transporter permease n=1 Tax=Halosimplex amylolyticum TaxID=3396616 RepID=UPI003F579492
MAQNFQRAGTSVQTDIPPYQLAGLRKTLAESLAYARNRDYRGWDYVDGMSSALLQALPIDSKYLNLAVQETIKRAPVNLRPYFLVEQRRNFKGIALFSMANFSADRLLDGRSTAFDGPDDVATDGGGAASYETESTKPSSQLSGGETVSGEAQADAGRETAVDFREEGIALCTWLLKNRSTGYSGFCGGHNHVIQGLHHQGPVNDPDLVSTSYAVKALLRAAEFHEPFAETARTAADWAINDMNYREVDGGAKITYYPKHPDDAYTLNAGAIAARMFADLYEYFGDDGFRRYAEALLAFIADQQTPEGGWYYRTPADASHLSMDNHHNGFIIESFQRYREVTGTTQFHDTLGRALKFYRSTLFDSDGAPNWDEDSTYPRDIHAAAQGILVFTYVGNFEFARRIIDWARENLSDGEGRFFFRKQRYYTKRITLMRWCQAWMAYAISEFLTVAGDKVDLSAAQP